MKPNFKNPLLAAALTITLAAQSSQAASGTWNNVAGGNWGDAANWSPVAVPGTTAGDVINLNNNITSNATVIINAGNVTMGTLNIGDIATGTPAASTNGFILNRSGSNILIMDNGGTNAVINKTGTIADTINAPIQINSNLTVTAGNQITLGGGITEAGGIRSLTKGGGNALVINGLSAYSGVTTINAGTIRFVTQNSLYGNDESKWTAANINVKSNSTLAFNVGGSNQFTDANVTLLLSRLAVSNSANEGMIAGANLAFSTDSTPNSFTLNGLIADTTGTSGGVRNLQKLAIGKLVLTNANTYTGTTTISGGSSGPPVVASILRLENTTASSSITMGSTSALEIGTDTAYSGPRIISTAGTIVSDRLTAGAGLTHVFSGVSRIATGTTNVTAGTNVTSGTAAIQFASLDNDNGTTANFGLNPTTANVIVAGGVSMGGGANAGIANFTLGGVGSVNSIGGAIVNGARATANLIKSGTSTWTLSGENTYNGTTAVNGGVLRLNNASAIPGGIGASGGTGNISLGGGILGLDATDLNRTLGIGANQIQLLGNNSGFAAFTTNRLVNLGSALNWGTAGSTGYDNGSLQLSHSTANATITLSSDLALAASGNRFLVVNDGSVDVDAIVSGQISGGSSSGLSKGGSGLLVLTNTSNNWVGQTFIDSGTLRLGASGVIPDLTLTVKRGNNNLANGVFDLGGYNETIGSLNLGESNPNATNIGQTPSVINSGASAVLTLGGNVTYNAGPGTGVSSNGQATISASLALGGAAAVIRDFNVADSASAPIDLLVSGSISDGLNSNGIQKNGTGLMAISGTNTYTGNTTINGGTLAISGAGSIANSPQIQINSSATLDVAGITGSTFTLGASQTLTGGGTLLTGGKTVNVTGTLAPGASPGTLTQDGGSMQLAVGGDYNWQILNASALAGTGYDTTSLVNSASLDLSQLSAGNTFNINLWSLSATGPDVNGNATSFDNTLAYSWTLFSTGTTISGFSTDKFTINTGAFNGTNGFSNDLGGGAFSVGLADADTDLVLQFTPIPEPNVAALLGSLGALALLRRRR